MRKKYQCIDDEEKIAAILAGSTIGRLATIGSEGYPYITPLNYVYWNKAIYFHCAREGEKVDNFKRDNKVCFEVDNTLAYIGTDFDPDMEPCKVSQLYQSVIIQGRAEIVEDLDEKIGALNALMASHENVKVFDAINSATKAVSLCLVVAVRIDTISGKENLFQRKSEQEREKIRKYLRDRALPGDKKAVDLIP